MGELRERTMDISEGRINKDEIKKKNNPKAKRLCHPFSKGVNANKMLSQLIWYVVVSQDSLVAFSVRLLIFRMLHKEIVCLF